MASYVVLRSQFENMAPFFRSVLKNVSSLETSETSLITWISKWSLCWLENGGSASLYNGDRRPLK